MKIKSIDLSFKGKTIHEIVPPISKNDTYTDNYYGRNDVRFYSMSGRLMVQLATQLLYNNYKGEERFKIRNFTLNEKQIYKLADAITEYKKSLSDFRKERNENKKRN